MEFELIIHDWSSSAVGLSYVLNNLFIVFNSIDLDKDNIVSTSRIPSLYSNRFWSSSPYYILLGLKKEFMMVCIITGWEDSNVRTLMLARLKHEVIVFFWSCSNILLFLAWPVRSYVNYVHFISKEFEWLHFAKLDIILQHLTWQANTSAYGTFGWFQILSTSKHWVR